MYLYLSETMANIKKESVYFRLEKEYLDKIDEIGRKRGVFKVIYN
jgi:hypothetical protein